MTFRLLPPSMLILLVSLRMSIVLGRHGWYFLATGKALIMLKVKRYSLFAFVHISSCYVRPMYVSAVASDSKDSHSTVAKLLRKNIEPLLIVSGKEQSKQNINEVLPPQLRNTRWIWLCGATVTPINAHAQ